IPAQPGLTDHNAAEAEPALIQAVLSHLLARARQVSQSVDTRVKAVVQKCIAYGSVTPRGTAPWRSRIGLVGRCQPFRQCPPRNAFWWWMITVTKPKARL